MSLKPFLPEHSYYGYTRNSCSEPVYVSRTDRLKSLCIRQSKKSNLWGFSGYKTMGGTYSIVSLLYKLLLVGDFFIILQWRLSQVSKGCLPVHSMYLFSLECVFSLTFFKKAWEAIIRNSARLAVFVNCFSFWSLPGFQLCAPLWAWLCSYFFLVSWTSSWHVSFQGWKECGQPPHQLCKVVPLASVNGVASVDTSSERFLKSWFI